MHNMTAGLQKVAGRGMRRGEERRNETESPGRVMRRSSVRKKSAGKGKWYCKKGGSLNNGLSSLKTSHQEIRLQDVRKVWENVLG